MGQPPTAVTVLSRHNRPSTSNAGRPSRAAQINKNVKGTVSLLRYPPAAIGVALAPSSPRQNAARAATSGRVFHWAPVSPPLGFIQRAERQAL